MVSTNSNPIIVMLQVEAGFVSKYNVVHACGFQSRVNGRLADIPLCCKRRRKGMDIDKVELQMNKASNHKPKLTASYLANKESGTQQ
ncbi:hypothetical protein TNCV_1472191 [Trichonephila clavipes]|nr:hypothetical protein TNCV_1472191 [Trichonephila clavipes]